MLSNVYSLKHDLVCNNKQNAGIINCLLFQERVIKKRVEGKVYAICAYHRLNEKFK